MRPIINEWDLLSSHSPWQAIHPDVYDLAVDSRALIEYILPDIRADVCLPFAAGCFFQPASQERDDHEPVEASKMSSLGQSGAIWATPAYFIFIKS
jgi:hypothetical protein